MSNEEALKTRIAELEAEIKSLKNSIVDNKDNYGLRWIDVPEAFEKESEEKIPVLDFLARERSKTPNAAQKKARVVRVKFAALGTTKQNRFYVVARFFIENWQVEHIANLLFHMFFHALAAV